MQRERLLKKDLFGEIWLLQDTDRRAILRNTDAAPIWTRPIARWLMRREAAALAALDGIGGIPQIIACDRTTLTRSWLQGTPLFEHGDPGAQYFVDALRLLRRLHAAGVVHNDLAKEPNILVATDGTPAFIDFQLASFSPRRGQLWRLAAREDLRHLYKHKRSYQSSRLTTRQRALLSTPSLPSRIWMANGETRLCIRHTTHIWLGRSRRCLRPWPAGLTYAKPVYSHRTPQTEGLNVNFCHPHNLVRPDSAGRERTYGIRVTLPANDSLRNLLGDDWERLHWYPGEAERDAAFKNMAERHGYYRNTDNPTQILEKISR